MANTVEAHVVARLLAHPGVAEQIGDRIFPVVLPTEVMPAIVYRRLSGRRQGSFSSSNKIATFALEISAWASDYGEARLLADNIRLALDGWHDEEGGVEVSFVEDGPDLYEPDAPPGCDFRCLLDVEVMFVEEQPEEA